MPDDDRERLDAELALRDERITAQRDIQDERWRAHGDAHGELARCLSDYKKESNEWRGTVSDLRAAFVLKTEYGAKHEGLRVEIAAELKSIETRLGTVETWQLARDSRERGVTSTLTAQRAILLVVGSIIGTVVALGTLVNLFQSLGG